MSNEGFEKWDYEFDGAHIDPNMLQSRAGVYVIWCQDGDNWTILDVGESNDVVDRISNHPRADCWTRNCTGVIRYSTTYTSDLQERLDLEQRIRDEEDVICGER